MHRSAAMASDFSTMSLADKELFSSKAFAAACAYGPPEPMATMPCSGSSTSPMPVMINECSRSATASIASSRRRMRSVRQSLASSTAERIRLPWCLSSLPSKRSNSVNASAVPPAKPARMRSWYRRLTFFAPPLTTTLPRVTWPSPPSATIEPRRTERMVVPWNDSMKEDALSGERKRDFQAYLQRVRHTMHRPSPRIYASGTVAEQKPHERALIMALDPVCGMTVDPAKAAGHLEHKGRTYHFCSKHCLHAFSADPGKYLTPEGGHPQPAREGVRYTCPMHPEIVQIGPGSCPKCGMALVPMEGGVEDDSELRDQTRRLWVSAALSAPLLLIAMAPMLGFPAQFKYSRYVELVLATPVVWWGGWPFFRKFWLSLKNRSPNMYTLIGLGVGLAYVYSVVAVAAPATTL